MASNIETKIMLEAKRKGLDPDEVLQLMMVPFEWTGNSYLFNFDSIPIEELSNYIDYIFRKQGYSLDKGTQIDGIYVKTRFGDSLAYKRLPIEYRYKVEMCLNEGKTYLKISRMLQGGLMSADKTIYGENYLNSELNKIVDQLEFLKPSIKGYLICNKCGAYYEVHKEESPKDFPDKCECDGTFEYIALPDLPDERLVERKRTASPTEYLRAPMALIVVSSACIGSMGYNQSIVATSGMFGLGFGMVLLLIRDKSQELVFSMISRCLIYLLSAVLFFVEGGVLFNVWIQANNSVILMIISLIFVFIAVIFGLGMIFKMISPDNPRNFLDPPL
ncbi:MULTISPECIES: hypothetical protein [Methanobacterium]|jgi:hypothetical protein|uniref:Uncharacterized protein n=1 Tax=Methanobacterium veterum TaxID=408577 RepID=A0A9E5A3U4_9EURY|nr:MULTISPECIES: hypothetical protein [Methanobacterium]MCZ3365610.1 hypothetical protein [Methanobacterium veterum]MCZ3371073.1 hypothetical protein [Methanobacterium veterum]